MLTVVIITKNAEKTIQKTLDSVKDLGQILVVDDFSTDKTPCIAIANNCMVIQHHEYNLGRQREYAKSLVTTEWTLFLDSDEVVPKELKNEITKAIQSGTDDSYLIPFRNHLFGKELKHGETHKKLVLFKTKKGHISDVLVHENVDIQGTVGALQNHALHFSYQSVFQILRKFTDYALRQAKEYKKQKIKWGVKEVFCNPLHMFVTRFFYDKGYKDGWRRIFLDLSFAYMELLSYILIPFVKTKLRIAVDAGPYAQGQTVQSGIDRLLQGIMEGKLEENDYYFFSFHPQARHTLPSFLYSHVWLPLAVLIHRSDVFLGTAGTIPWILQFFPLRKILFLHDFGFYDQPFKYHKTAVHLQKQTEQAIVFADSIVVFHEYIYHQCIRKFPNESWKVMVIPAGADHLQRREEQQAFLQNKRPIYLYVGVVKPIKQVERLIEAVYPHYLVIAGPQEKEYVQKLKKTNCSHVQFIQHYSDEQLKWLYKQADCLVYASEQEGFCYPVLEALTSGLPVVAFSNPLFQYYTQYFPHLTLVDSVQGMREKMQNKLTKHISSIKHPFHWKDFNTKLSLLYQSNRTNFGKPSTEPTCCFICVLFNTDRKEIERLEKEIRSIGLSHYSIQWIDHTNTRKGYAEGVNKGVVNGLKTDADVFIAINPDISLAGIRKEQLLSGLTHFDVFGFSMNQNNTMYYGGTIDRWRMSGGLNSKKPIKRFSCVDFVTGSCILFTRKVVNTIGLWDTRFGMYYEDVDFSLRARKAGFHVGIDSETTYTHFEVSQQSRQKEHLIWVSRWKFFLKQANGIQVIREIIRLPMTIIEKKKRI